MNYDIHWDSIKYQNYWQNFDDTMGIAGIAAWGYVKEILKKEYNVDFLYISDQPHLRFESSEAFFEFQVIWS